MPELKLSIGERDFEVACQEGEEKFLTEAANLLNAESQKLVSQLGSLSESRMLLMAGLMLADKMINAEKYAKTNISLPIYGELSKQELNYIYKAIK